MYSDEHSMGGAAAEEEMLDLIEGVDEDGNNILLEVVRYFFYNGEEYVVLGEAHEGDCDCDECEHCDHDHEEDEDLLEKLIEVVQADFEADEAFDDE